MNNNIMKNTSCYHSHPVLDFGKEYFIRGGSCISPVDNSCHIYVGLENGMHVPEQIKPWNNRVAFTYYITNMRTPKNPGEFKKMIEWLAVQVDAGARLHVGCIGGHGRTGMVLSALKFVITGDKDATAYLREHYCPKAVESQVQLNFLKKHYGIKLVDPVAKKYKNNHINTYIASQFADNDDSFWPDNVLPVIDEDDNDDDYNGIGMI